MRTVLPCVLLLSLAACASAPKHPKSVPAVREPEPDLTQQVSAQEAASMPGTMHKRLDVLVGDWQVTVTRISAEGTEVPGGTGVTRITQLYGGRYQRWDGVMEIGGRKQETTGWLGYDRNEQEYQLCMITSFSSGMGIYHGLGDLTKDGILFVFEKIDGKTGAHVRSRNRLKLITPDNFVIEDVDEELVAHSRSHYRRVK